MKKFVSILLALAMILAMSTTAFATTVTVSDASRTYNGYKLLDLTVSPKSDCGCAEGAAHKDTCYNYAYSVNAKYAETLQTMAGTNNDILDYLDSLQGDNENGTGTPLRDVADEIYNAIKNKDPDATNLTGSGDEIAQGYWLFVDVTDLKDQNDANSLVIVDTKGLDALTINPKVALPTVVKKVQDTNDSTGVTSGWQDSADHDINDSVAFQLTATLPSNLASYESYAIIFHDTLSAGLTLDANSIKVFAGTTDVTSSFTKTTTGLTDGCSFEVSCTDVTNIAGVTKDTVFVVTYSATLNEQANIGAEGNPNEVYLEFSNNPYGDGTGKTETDKVIVFTYQVTINKVDSENEPLEGAGFILYKKDSTGEYVQIGDELVGGTMTTFTWKGLDDGDYKLEEKTVPAGYNKMEDKEFTITAVHTEEADAPSLTSLTSTLGTVTDGVIEDSIVNQTGTVLPETGARGTMMLITCSSMFIMVAAVFMITRKKMSIYED